VVKGEKVRGLTGVVITRKPGLVKAVKDLSLDEENPVRIRAGEVIYVLHSLGEGYWLFWFKGRTHSGELAAEKVGVGEGLQVLSVPKSVWWVKVKNSRGEVGWTNQPDHFDHIDACE
jgi:hypothetical protein